MLVSSTSWQFGVISPLTQYSHFILLNLSPPNGLYSGAESWIHISHRTLEHLSRDMWQYAKKSVEGFHNTIQCWVTRTHPSIWKMTPLLMNKENLAKKEKVRCWIRRQSTSKKKKKMYNIMNETLWRQVFSYNPQNKISCLQSMTMNLNTF